MPIRMMKNFCLVKKFAPRVPDGIVTSLIAVPETAKEKNPLGEIVACGPGRWSWDKKLRKEFFTETCVKPGDVVVLPQYATGERVVSWYAEGDSKVAEEKFGVALEDGEELIIFPDTVIAGVIEDYVPPKPSALYGESPRFGH